MVQVDITTYESAVSELERINALCELILSNVEHVAGHVKFHPIKHEYDRMALNMLTLYCEIESIRDMMDDTVKKAYKEKWTEG